MADALPPIDSALIPASVRDAGPKAQKLYTAALSFEQQLTQQLAQSLTSTLQDPSAGTDGTDGTDGSDGSDDSSGADSSTTMLQQMLPDALAQGMTQAGGLGLAQQLYEALGGATTGSSTKVAGT
jgi:Rod binding domain-containing protein